MQLTNVIHGVPHLHPKAIQCTFYTVLTVIRENNTSLMVICDGMPRFVLNQESRTLRVQIKSCEFILKMICVQLT